MTGEKSVISKFLGQEFTGDDVRKIQKNPIISNYRRRQWSVVSFLVKKTADERTSKIQKNPIIFNFW